MLQRRYVVRGSLFFLGFFLFVSEFRFFCFLSGLGVPWSSGPGVLGSRFLLVRGPLVPWSSLCHDSGVLNHPI